MEQLASFPRLAVGSPASRRDMAQCSNCSMPNICVPKNVDTTTLGTIETLIQNARSLRRGQYVYRSDHEVSYLFAVRSGSVKTVLRTGHGKEQIVGVHRPGDVLGLDGLATGRYAFDAVALQDTTLCLIPYNRFSRMCRDVPALQQRFIEILGHQVVRAANVRMCTSMQSIESRIVAFFMDLAEHHAKRGFSSREFAVDMTRAEIGNYLGTTLETVSRVISALSRDGIIEAHAKRIRVLDLERLKARLVSHAAKPEPVAANAEGDQESMLADVAA
jgi:CRP/FNR family transcriptional regulator, anaerobic regulatory protein